MAHTTGNSVPEEARHPTYGLITTLRCRRLKWARQELVTHVQEGRRPTARELIFVARKMLAEGGYAKGFVLEDAPEHGSIEDLLDLSLEDRDEQINKLDTKQLPRKGKRGGDADKCTETGEGVYPKNEKNMEFKG